MTLLKSSDNIVTHMSENLTVRYRVLDLRAPAGGEVSD